MAINFYADKCWIGLEKARNVAQNVKFLSALHIPHIYSIVACVCVCVYMLRERQPELLRAQKFSPLRKTRSFMRYRRNQLRITYYIPRPRVRISNRPSSRARGILLFFFLSLAQPEGRTLYYVTWFAMFSRKMSFFSIYFFFNSLFVRQRKFFEIYLNKRMKWIFYILSNFCY